MKLKDRVAIVTGGGRGLGREMALAFAEEGADLVLAARTQSEIEAVAQEVRALGRKALPIPTDVSMEEQANRMVQKTIDEFGRIDILVNNAGGSFNTRGILLRDLSLDTWRQVLDINLTGTFLCSRAVLKYMMPRRSGVIINIITGQGITQQAGRAAYWAAKSGQEGLTQAMGRELAPFNIRVNALNPGWALATKPVLQQPESVRGELLPPNIMREPAVYLASDDSIGVTAQSLIATKYLEDQKTVRNFLERQRNSSPTT